MAIAKVASVANTAGTATTSAITTTGANLLVGAVNTAAGTSSTSWSDSKSNSYTGVTAEIVDNTPPQAARMFYSGGSPTVGSSHTFTVGAFYEGANAIAFSGIATSSPLATSAGRASNASVTSHSAGSVTPTEDGCLVVTHIAIPTGVNMTTITGPSGYTVELNTNGNTSVLQSAMAWKVLGSGTSGVAIDPTWTLSSSARVITTTAVFKSDAPPASSSIAAISNYYSMMRS